MSPLNNISAGLGHFTSVNTHAQRAFISGTQMLQPCEQSLYGFEFEPFFNRIGKKLSSNETFATVKHTVMNVDVKRGGFLLFSGCFFPPPVVWCSLECRWHFDKQEESCRSSQSLHEWHSTSAERPQRAYNRAMR